ncbi:MAG: bifunctional 3,4-dihydroxy-2-butanone-4-phosphate synthase/GTP cyclohydrolase II [Cyanobacteriota bacterium]|nr:bifunctional 3,4-dihydroxy-2-butanone-4-phosphate synthase/GTP cyclohydrolase II [Cyanobacteriota bacterium]MDY6364700.1 bifunctional 3,4-dihydroxy-2-butanone-4-phosphate synthase/GTP cyclohydrolase II [Cyanobacteriota bacterium]MDY6383363.1 bifunctional 3,4-dihydroxy-2-butanone-4-phosphate synthase/GTP cyclohydrolase II [Cyanobacteriota bacterium]
MEECKFDKIEDAIKDFKAGIPVIVADDEDRENEGDIIVSAQTVTPDKINFLASEAKGLICLAISSDIAKKLELEQMVEHNSESMKTAFTISIDAAEKFGVTTGISAFDRAKTVEVAIAPDAVPSDLRRPGHLFPCVAKDGGVLARTGHTEAVVDLAKICGHIPAGVMCEVMAPDGHMARRDYLREFADKHNLKFITVADLIAYRLKSEQLVTRVAEADLPTKYGDFKIYGYKNHINGHEHVALVKDDGSDKIPAVRVHSMCLTGDVFYSLKCDCNSQLHNALKYINNYGKGAVVYLTDHEGRGIGLCNKIKAYKLQQEGQDTIQANISLGFKSDLRDYGTGAQIIRDLGYKEFNLITNNPKKVIGLKGYGLKINDIIKVPSEVTPYNKRYLETKKEKMHHTL